jgi:hypothetical protein
MTPAGWILLIASWGAILGIVTFCFVTMFKIGKR